MQMLRDDMEEAVAEIDMPESDRALIRQILYKEHLKKDENWDAFAVAEIDQLLNQKGEN